MHIRNAETGDFFITHLEIFSAFQIIHLLYIIQTINQSNSMQMNKTSTKNKSTIKYMKRAPFAMLMLMTVVLGVATFVEDECGTAFAGRYIYGSAWFTVLWTVISLSAIGLLAKTKIWKRKAVMMIHASFILILVGALTTSLTAEKGMLHLREGETVDRYLSEERILEQLPFSIRLDKYETEFHPGTDTPADYVSEIAVSYDGGKSFEEYRISMNKIFNRNGVRLYQSSYDDDGRGSYLSVNIDRWGVPITYAGYVLLFVSMIFMLMEKNGTFRRLIRGEKVAGIAVALLLFLINIQTTEASEKRMRGAVTEEQAEAFGKLQVMYNGRICPVQTLALDFTRKLTGDNSYRSFTAEQVFLSFIFYPEVWIREKLIEVDDSKLRNKYHLPERASMLDFFPEGRYIFANTSAPSKAVMEMDEKISLIVMAQEGHLLQMFPIRDGGRILWTSPCIATEDSIADRNTAYGTEILRKIDTDLHSNDGKDYDKIIKELSDFQRKNGGKTFLPERKVNAEILLNHLHTTGWMFKLFLTMGILLIPAMKLKEKHPKALKILHKCFLTIIVVCASLLTAVLSLRWYVGGHFPMSNGYETMQTLALMIMLGTLVIGRKHVLFASLGMLTAGFALLVSSLSEMNPQITHLMPVLSSPLLSIHVSSIMASYAMLSLTFFIAVGALARPSATEESMRLIYLILYPALTLLTIGIFVGAVWANVSWGTYWSWDPKEVWALITMLIYSMPLHRQSLPFFRKRKCFLIYIAGAFATVLMTYFGVNYILGGMHSYANQ